MAGERLKEWYSGESILITGGSGFIGKVLIEKLLRCCPDVGTIYVLCRHKNGRTPITRLADIILKPTIYDRLKKENPGVFNKLEVVEGDIEQNGVVTKAKDREKLTENVSIVFHLAASLKQEAPLSSAVKTNAKGTLNMLEFCKTFKQLKAFVHLSTSFCHCELDVLEEKYYPPPRDPYEIMNMVTSVDPESLQAMTPGILGVHPNSYIFSKRLAESIVNEYSKDIPCVIIRPSIVTPAIYEPVPGWVDSLNGPIGILVGSAKGVVRSIRCNPKNRAETVPVDIAINAILSITADIIKNSGFHELDFSGKADRNKDVPCYNVSSGEIVPLTWGEFFQHGKKQFLRYPFEAGLWYAGGTIRTNPYTHALAVFFLQTVPAYFIDFLMLLFHKKTFLVSVQNRISVGQEVLQYISMRKWEFRIDKGIHQQINRMHPKDKKIFFIDNVDKDVDQYLLKAVLGARQFSVQEPLSTLTKAKIQLWLLFFLDLIVKVGVYYLIYVYVSATLGFINPSYQLPELSYEWFDYAMQKAVS